MGCISGVAGPFHDRFFILIIMKKRKVLLVLTVCLLGFFQAQEICAESGTCGENVVWSFRDSVLTISGTGPMHNYSKEDGKQSPWYLFRHLIKEVVIRQTVTSIGKYAFYQCSNLTSFNIPNSITDLSEGVFYGCSSLTSITIPESITGIYPDAFNGCVGLKSVISFSPVPPSAYIYGCSAFRGVDLSSVTLYVPSVAAYYNAETWKDFGTITESFLISLTISESILTPEFHPNTYSYSLEVEAHITQLTINTETVYPSVAVTVQNNESLSPGFNDVLITVAFNGIETTYEIEVFRKSISNFKLKSLIIREGDLFPEFDPDIHSYNLEVENDITQLTISTELYNPFVELRILGNNSLLLGDNSVAIETFYNDILKETYNIKVFRKSNNNSKLEYIKVSDGTLSPVFQPDILNYTVTVPYSVSSVAVDVKPVFYYAVLWSDLEQPGTKSLKVGENIFNFGVLAENRIDYNIYVLTVIREDSPTGFGEIGEHNRVHVYTANGRLHVNSPEAEQINVYSVTGKFLYGLEKPSGKTSVVISRPERILIVRGSSGWVRKVII